jgi:hypothetical protein
MQDTDDRKSDKYAFYFLITSVLALVTFYFYDTGRFDAIGKRGARTTAQVVHVQFLRNDWNILLEYQYKGKWHVQHCLSTEEYHVGDTVVVKFEVDKPEDRLLILGRDSIAHY